MSILQLIIILASLMNLLLAVVVLKRNINSKINLSFGIFALITFAWALTNFLLLTIPSLLFLRLAYSFGILVAATGLSWVWVLCTEEGKSIPKISYFLGTVFFIFGNTSLVVKGFEGFSPSSGPLVVYGVLFYLSAFYMLATLATILVRLFVTARSSVGIKKSQVLFIFMGASIFGLISLVCSFLLPLFGYDKFLMLDSPSSLIFVSFSTYAIIRHRLMDIRAVVAKSIAYTILIGILAGGYSGLIIISQRILFEGDTYTPAQTIVQIILAMLIAFTFQPLRKWVTKITDSFFFKNQYNPEVLLTDLSHMLGSTIVLVELLYKTMDLMIREMKVSRTFFVIADKDSVYKTQTMGYKKTPEISHAQIEIFHDAPITVMDELEEGSRAKSVLRKYDATIAIPLKTEKEFVGVLFVGEKSSGDMFSAQDLRMFEIIAPEISVAVENAKSYEDIQNFNVILRAEVKKAVRELEIANSHLKELDKAKDEFISMASHQLRTPLTAIKGYLSMLLEGDAGEIKVGQFDFISESYNAANRTIALINDLLNVSRMETGRFFLEMTRFDLEKIVQEEFRQLEKTAKDKGLKFVLNTEKVPKIYADEVKIRQVVMNFIDNALHYTTDGKVEVSLHGDEKDNVYFEVHDSGIGIAKEQQKNLFTKFYRAENARRVRPDGTGLGLFLAKRVIEEHGGKLIFASKEGDGSTFGFRISPDDTRLRAKIVPKFDDTIAKDTKVSDLSAKSSKKDYDVVKKDLEKAEARL